MPDDTAARRLAEPAGEGRNTTPAEREEIIAAAPAPAVPSRSRKRRARLILMVIVPLLAALGAGYVYLTGGRYVSTDDAYVQADKLQVSTDVSGIVKEIDVREGQEVKAGDILFRLDPQPFQIALDGAKADLAETALAIDAMIC
jgi:membrane fusion protein, multidrug efflux system